MAAIFADENTTANFREPKDQHSNVFVIVRSNNSNVQLTRDHSQLLGSSTAVLVVHTATPAAPSESSKLITQILNHRLDLYVLECKQVCELSYVSRFKANSNSIRTPATVVEVPVKFVHFSSNLNYKMDFHGAEIIAVAKVSFKYFVKLVLGLTTLKLQKDSKALEPKGTYDIGTFEVQQQKDVGAAIFWTLQEMLNFT